MSRAAHTLDSQLGKRSPGASSAGSVATAATSIRPTTAQPANGAGFPVIVPEVMQPNKPVNRGAAKRQAGQCLPMVSFSDYLVFVVGPRRKRGVPSKGGPNPRSNEGLGPPRQMRPVDPVVIRRLAQGWCTCELMTTTPCTGVKSTLVISARLRFACTFFRFCPAPNRDPVARDAYLAERVVGLGWVLSPTCARRTSVQAPASSNKEAACENAPVAEPG